MDVFHLCLHRMHQPTNRVHKRVVPAVQIKHPDWHRGFLTIYNNSLQIHLPAKIDTSQTFETQTARGRKRTMEDDRRFNVERNFCLGDTGTSEDDSTGGGAGTRSMGGGGASGLKPFPLCDLGVLGLSSEALFERSDMRGGMHIWKREAKLKTYSNMALSHHFAKERKILFLDQAFLVTESQCFHQYRVLP